MHTSDNAFTRSAPNSFGQAGNMIMSLDFVSRITGNNNRLIESCCLSVEAYFSMLNVNVFPTVFKTSVISNNNEKFRSFKSKENIYKKEVGLYRGFGY